MPKMKTHSASKDRIRITKTGKVLTQKANRNHNLSKKSAARKRTFGNYKTLSGSVKQTIKRSLGA